jgi:hypothetical protein
MRPRVELLGEAAVDDAQHVAGVDLFSGPPRRAGSGHRRGSQSARVPGCNDLTSFLLQAHTMSRVHTVSRTEPVLPRPGAPPLPPAAPLIEQKESIVTFGTPVGAWTKGDWYGWNL